MRFFRNTSDGFSLVELMVSTSIIATVVSMAVPNFVRFQNIAKEAEANAHLRAITGLAQSYLYDENDRTLNSYNTYIKNNFSTETSCNPINPLGFRVSDCRKMGFVYGVAVSQKRTFGVYAIEAGSTSNKRIYKKCGGSSFWAGNTTNIYNGISPSRAVNCLVCFGTKLAAMNGSTDLSFDINGDGVVDLDDNNQLLQHFAMFGAGAAMPHLMTCP